MRRAINILKSFLIVLTLGILGLVGYSAIESGQLTPPPEKTYMPSPPAAKPEGDADDRVLVNSSAMDIPGLGQTYFISKMDSEMQALAAHIYRGIMDFEDEIQLPSPIEEERLNEIMWMINYDCPELFHISGDYSYFVGQKSPGKVFAIKPTYIMIPGEYEKALEQTRDLLSKWIGEAGTSDYEKQFKLYTNLIDTCSYEEAGKYAGTAYGALVLGQARCEGYSKALCMGLRMAGIDAMILTGEAQTSQSNAEKRIQKHAWNMAKIDGYYYQMDATWDDSDDTLPYDTCYAYFNLTDEEMYKSRSLDEIYQGWDLPACTYIGLNYYYKNGLVVREGKDIRRKLHDLLIDAYEFDLPYISCKLFTDEQLAELTEHMESWMQSWYEEMGFTSGTYSWLTYADGRVFCVINPTYSK